MLWGNELKSTHGSCLWCLLFWVKRSPGNDVCHFLKLKLHYIIIALFLDDSPTLHEVVVDRSLLRSPLLGLSSSRCIVGHLPRCIFLIQCTNRKAVHNYRLEPYPYSRLCSECSWCFLSYICKASLKKQLITIILTENHGPRIILQFFSWGWKSHCMFFFWHSLHTYSD